MQIQPYLYFDGRCEEALEFYRTALGARTEMMMRFKDSPDARSTPPGGENKIMHATVRVGDSRINVSDGNSQNGPKFQGFGLTITTSSEDEVQRFFTALSHGGKVQMPPGKTFFSPLFAMVTDRFGVLWILYVAAAQ